MGLNWWRRYDLSFGDPAPRFGAHFLAMHRPRLSLPFGPVRLAREARRGPEGVMVIEGARYRDRTIRGPAVVYLRRDCLIEGCSWYGRMEAVFVEYTGEWVPVGAIVLDDCTFEDCHLRDVSIIATPEDIARHRMGVHQEQFEPEPERGTVSGLPASEAVS
jgi:hypothetical protein